MKAETHDEFSRLRLPDTALWTPGPHAAHAGGRAGRQNLPGNVFPPFNDFRTVYARAVDLLREAFHVPETFTPLVFGHAASYNWEMVAVNTPPAYRAVGLDIGAFSARWAGVFRRLDRAVDVLKAYRGGTESVPIAWREAHCSAATTSHC